MINSNDTTPPAAPTRITMLGTGSAMSINYYNTCFYIHTPGGGMLVDGGGGNAILRRLIDAGIPFDSIRHMFVTHCHTDHILGAVWMIRQLAPMMARGSHPGPFTIYCNDVVAHALFTMCDLMVPRDVFAAIGHNVVLQQVQHGQTLAIDDMRVTFFDIGSPVDKQYGFNALLPDGQRLACLGDEPCRPCSHAHVRGCDWLMCEAFCLYDERDTHEPYRKGHSTVRDAAIVASQLEAAHLVLYHTEDSRPAAARAAAYRAEAAQHYPGPILVPADLETFTLTSRVQR